MTPDRRTFVQAVSALFVNVVLAPLGLSAATRSQGPDDLDDRLTGSWSLRSYTYTSNDRTYAAPDQLEATATFADGTYEVQFAAHIRAVGISRTRRATESGTFTVSGDRIRLFADEANNDDELGEEFLTDVQIDAERMNLTSNNGITTEVWSRAS